jgi:hypothetical protein
VPLDPSSFFYRYRVDARAAWRAQIERLQALGVTLAPLPASHARPLLARFVHEFLDPVRAAGLAVELSAPRLAPVAFDFDRWLRPECVRRGATGCVRWLVPDGPEARCVRFERRADLPAVAIDLATMDDAWAGSWPGVFVRFDVGRAVVVTLDYEQFQCEVRTGGGTPYR